jgi:hypothetical protein
MDDVIMERFYFITEYEDSVQPILASIFKKELENRGYTLYFYEKYTLDKFFRAKTNASRSVVLEICSQYNIDIIAQGIKYKKGVWEKEIYGYGYE